MRVVVAESAVAARVRIVRALAADANTEIVGVVSRTSEAVTLCERLRPDLLTLAPRLSDGPALRVVQHLMASRPTPILVLPVPREEPPAPADLDALLRAGAVDVLRPAALPETDREWEARLVAAARTVARIRVITHPSAQRVEGATPGARRLGEGTPGAPRYRAVTLGASTGGPAAVSELLRVLPADFPLPILLVIHVGLTFGDALARWLDDLAPLRVSIAEDDSPLPPVGEGRVLMAPPDRHLLLEGGRLRLTSGLPRYSCRPSVDVLFESVARELGRTAIGGLLTGMGRDGSEGLLALRRAGAATFAQEEASCAVFGMPREAIALGAAQRVMVPTGIGRAIAALGTASAVSRSK